MSKRAEEQQSFFTAILRGNGAVAQALQKAIAIATRAVYIEGENPGIANTGFMLTINHYRDSGSRKLDKHELAPHVHRYLEWMHDTASEAPFFFGRDKLDAVRISLDVQTTDDDGKVRRLDADQLLSYPPRQHIVLLAGPGQGKSLTLLTLARLMSEHLLAKRGRLDARLMRKQTGFDRYQDLIIPFYLPLNLYAEHLEKQGARDNQLVAFLNQRLKGEAPYLPDDFAHTLITADHPLVLLLDGLDEIVDPTMRGIVAEHIRQLGQGKSRVRLVVSSRPSAYGASEDLGAKFRPFTIAPFDPDKRRALLRAIYQRLKPKYGNTTAAVVEGEINELERAQHSAGRAPLIDSPLMTALAVHVRELDPQRTLPTERAAFLAKAVEALLRSNYALDAQEVSLIESAVGGWQNHRRLLAGLAYDMHFARTQEITEKRLRTRLSEAGADAPMANALIEFAQSRGGVLRRRAWGEAGAGRYGFVHLSLQQALTAFHMVEGQEPEKMARFFARDGVISTEWWREVAELVAGNLHEWLDNPQGDNNDLRAFVLALAAQARTPDTPPEARFACAELAIAAAEQFLPDHDDLRAPLARAAADVFEDAAATRGATAARRMAFGDALGRMGDPRAHVMDADAMQLCFVPRGPFMMGSEQYDDEHPTHEVNIAHDFWIGQYPVTNAQFNAFVQEKGYANGAWWEVARAARVWRGGQVIQRVYRFNPDALTLETRAEWELLRGQGRYAEADYVLARAKAGGLVEKPVSEPAGVPVLGAEMTFADRVATYPNHPVVGITWYEALAFCAWLEARWRARGWLSPAMQVTLPGEAEWEKAARGGLEVPVSVHIVTAAQLRNAGPMAMQRNDMPRRDYPWGGPFDPAWANTLETNHQNTSAAGSFPMNRSPYGCIEMSGNVWEWTRSLYGPYDFDARKATLAFPYPYTDRAVEREDLFASADVTRVVRGGSWSLSQDDARCACRYRSRPDLRFYNIGFRVVVRSAPVR